MKFLFPKDRRTTATEESKDTADRNGVFRKAVGYDLHVKKISMTTSQVRRWNLGIRAAISVGIFKFV
jgi:hypothetical protein